MRVYVIKADSHMLRRSPVIGPRGAAGRGTGESREPRRKLGNTIPPYAVSVV